jgi:hypothetical protein
MKLFTCAFHRTRIINVISLKLVYCGILCIQTVRSLFCEASAACGIELRIGKEVPAVGAYVEERHRGLYSFGLVLKEYRAGGKSVSETATRDVAPLTRHAGNSDIASDHEP